MFGRLSARSGYLTLMVTWLCVIGALVFWPHDSRFEPDPNAGFSSDHFNVPKDEVRGFSAWQQEPGHPERPRYYISFDRLRAVNGQIGQFRTAAKRTVCVDNLNLKLHTYGTNPGVPDPANETLASSSSEETVSPEHYILGEIVNGLLDAKSNWKVNISLAGATALTIRGFDYQLTADGKPNLAVTCARANVIDWPAIALRGNVTVTTADGARLHANSINWETKTNTFRATGPYLLERNGVRSTGRDISLDARVSETPSVSQHISERTTPNG